MGDRPWKRQRLCDGDVVMLSPSPSEDEEEASDASPAPSTEASPQSEAEVEEEAESEEEEADVEYGEEIAALLRAAAARDGPAPVDPAYRAGTRAFHVVCQADADADASPLLARVDAAVHAQRLDAWHLEARLRARARLPPLAALAPRHLKLV